MELSKDKMRNLIGTLRKKGLISFDLFYRLYYMSIFGLNLYYRNKIASFRSCVFCRHLCYDKIIKKYICSTGEYEACASLVPCIIPSQYPMQNGTCNEEEDQIPWLFKKPCLDFDVLDAKNYFRNFVSFNVESSIIKLETLEDILIGSSSGQIPCHICASVDKENYTDCSCIKRAAASGKCCYIYDKLNEYYRKASVSGTNLPNVS
jgi:hypothetical protein